MPDLEEKVPSPPRKDPLKGKLRLLAHGDNRWDDDEYSADE